MEIIDETTGKKDEEFIDDSVRNEDIDFYHQVDFNIDEPLIKKGVGRLRIESESCNEECASEDVLSENYIGEIDPEYLFDFLDDPSVSQDNSGEIKQSKDSIYINLLYALRHARTGEVSHTKDFSSLDEGMLIELCSTKNQIEFDFVNPHFVDKLHSINDIIIPYGYFFNV